MPHIMEVVIFPARDGVDPARLQAAALAITPDFAAMPGFIARQFGATDDGRYADLITWQNHAAADLAARQVMEIPLCRAYFTLMDEENMQFTYFKQLS